MKNNNATKDRCKLPSIAKVLIIIIIGFSIANLIQIISTSATNADIETTILFTVANFTSEINITFKIFSALSLLLLHFFLIIKPSQRITEVIALFTLDAKPHNEMVIDSEIAQGLLTKEKASAKRDTLNKRSNNLRLLNKAVLNLKKTFFLETALLLTISLIATVTKTITIDQTATIVLGFLLLFHTPLIILSLMARFKAMKLINGKNA